MSARLHFKNRYKRADVSRKLHAGLILRMSRNSDFSYFSAAAPHSNTVPASSSSPAAPSVTQSLEITQPIITTSVLSSPRTGAFSYNQHVQNHHQLRHQQQLQQQHRIYTQPPEELRQFALHIPAPPQLTMPAKALAKQGATMPSSSSSSSPSSTLSPNDTPDFYPSSQSTSASRSPAFNSTSQGPDMVCTTDMHAYLFTISGLPSSITSDMVTISANKGDRLRVNAQAWGGENAGRSSTFLSQLFLKITNVTVCLTFAPIRRHLTLSHATSSHAANYDWQIFFPPRDVDLSRVQAKFDKGYLTIRVPRYYRADR